MTPLQEFAAAARRARIENPTLGEQLSAAFQRQHTVGMALDALSRPDFAEEEGFNPVEHMTLPELKNPRTAQAYIRARSMAELEYLRREARHLEELDAIISNGPLWSNAAVMIVVLLDPIALLLLAIGGVLLGKTQAPAWLCIIAGICIAVIMGMLVNWLASPFGAPFNLLERVVVYSLALFLIRWVTMRIAGNRAPKEE